MLMISSPLVLYIFLQLLPNISIVLLAFPGDHTESNATANPWLEVRPFTVVWNMPTANCRKKYGVHLNLHSFDIFENYHEAFLGENMALFYYNKLGLYPYLSKDGDWVNGGVPQRGDLQAHLDKTKAEIEYLLNPNFHGLGVIDWEKWHPLWARNFGAKRKYYKMVSEQLVKRDHPDLSSQEVQFLACKEFEKGAQQFMSRTLQLGVETRPSGLWGFYGFPACYNYYQGQHRLNYTGHCHPTIAKMNARLDWLWRQSSALYPSIYLPLNLAGSPDAALMVRYRILEALRVASTYADVPKSIPVLPYARVAFIHTRRFLNKTDLEHTLGEAAVLGAAGVVLWGELRFAKSKGRCLALQDYVEHTLGSFVKSLKSAAQHCSETLCSGNGRCAWRYRLSGRAPHQPEPLLSSVSGRPPSSSLTLDYAQLRAAFQCGCYQGWTGRECQERIL